MTWNTRRRRKTLLSREGTELRCEFALVLSSLAFAARGRVRSWEVITPAAEASSALLSERKMEDRVRTLIGDIELLMDLVVGAVGRYAVGEVLK